MQCCVVVQVRRAAFITAIGELTKTRLTMNCKLQEDKRIKIKSKIILNRDELQ